MSLNRRDIEHIARLARLALTEQEIPLYVEGLSRIMGLVGQLGHAHVMQVTHSITRGTRYSPASTCGAFCW